MRNLRKFNTEAEYSAATLNYPAVSWIVSADTVVYDKTEPTPPEPAYGGLTVKYYIADPSTEVTLFNGGGASSGSGSGSGSGGGALPTTMIVDGNEETPINTWRFETSGEHIVQYAFEDNEIPDLYFTELENITSVVVGDDITIIGNGAFGSSSSLTSVIIGSSVTNIGNGAFESCASLTSLIIPDSVTNIDFRAFYGGTSLTSITVNSVDPPQLGLNAFTNTNNCPIYVPASAVNTYKYSTSTGWYAYADRIQAIQ